MGRRAASTHTAADTAIYTVLAVEVREICSARLINPIREVRETRSGIIFEFRAVSRSFAAAFIRLNCPVSRHLSYRTEAAPHLSVFDTFEVGATGIILRVRNSVFCRNN